MLKQPHSQPKIIELQIVLVAFGTLGVLDLVPLEKVKFVIYYASFLVNFLFKSSILNILIYFLRYLNASQLSDVINSVTKYLFLKTFKINNKVSKNNKT